MFDSINMRWKWCDSFCSCFSSSGLPFIINKYLIFSSASFPFSTRPLRWRWLLRPPVKQFWYRLARMRHFHSLKRSQCSNERGDMITNHLPPKPSTISPLILSSILFRNYSSSFFFFCFPLVQFYGFVLFFFFLCKGLFVGSNFLLLLLLIILQVYGVAAHQQRRHASDWCEGFWL